MTDEPDVPQPEGDAVPEAPESIEPGAPESAALTGAPAASTGADTEAAVETQAGDEDAPEVRLSLWDIDADAREAGTVPASAVLSELEAQARAAYMRVEWMDRSVAFASACRLKALDDVQRLQAELDKRTKQERGVVFRDPADIARRSLRFELAAMLKISERAVDGLLADGRNLLTELTDTFALLRSGRITERHARVVAAETYGLDLEDRRWVEARALERIEQQTPAQLTKRLRRLREQRSPADLDERHADAREDRFVRIEPGQNGMAWLTAHLPNLEAAAVDARLDAVSHAARDAAGLAEKDGAAPDDRSIPQFRADAFAELLIHGATSTGTGAGVKPVIHIEVPVTTLLDADELVAPDGVRADGIIDATDGAVITVESGARERAKAALRKPCTVESLGPIDGDTARRLVSESSTLYRMLTDPIDGAMLRLDPTVYRPNTELRNWVVRRDVTCRAPFCDRPARHADLDHTRDWAHGGRTEDTNLAVLCTWHHALKHATGALLTQASDGSGRLSWTTPRGRTYATDPERLVRPWRQGQPPPERPRPQRGPRYPADAPPPF